MSGRLLIWDALDARFRTIRLRRDPGCALCGEGATIRDLSAHEGATDLGAVGPACAL
jgi:adenylyltransferase/sulfurtransferase